MGFKRYIKEFVKGGLIATKSLEGAVSTRNLERLQQVFYEIGFSKYTYAERDFKEFVENGYGRNPFVFMCVEKIADIGGDYDLIITDMNDEEIEVGPEVLNVLNSEKFKDFAKKAVKSWLVTGNAIIYETTPLGFDNPIDLDVAVVQDTTVYTDRGNEIQGTPVMYSIEYIGNIEAERVLHWKRANILRNTFWGLSPLWAGQTIYEGSNNTFKASASIHNNRGASGVLSSDSDMPLTPNERNDLQKQLDRDMAGAEKAGMNYVASTPIKYTQIGMSATDLELIKFNIEHLRYICSLYNLDSSIFNDPANKTYNNRGEAEKALHTNATLPVWSEFYHVLSVWWLQKKMGIQAKIKINKDKIEALQEGENERHDRVVSDLSAGILLPNEARAILYPELEALPEQEEQPEEEQMIDNEEQQEDENNTAGSEE